MARALRKRLTPQEVKLWVKLRELKPLGFISDVRHQWVDTSSILQHSVLDGGQHSLPEGAWADRQRDAFLRSQGFKVLRYWNSDVDQNLEGVIESILSELQTPPRRYAPTLPTLGGGGFGVSR